MRDAIKRLFEAFDRGQKFVRYDVWHIGKPGEAIPSGFIIKQIRVAILLVSNLVRGTVMLRASALTFATVLYIVPLLAIIFYVFQTFNLTEGVSHQLQTRIESALSRTVRMIPGFGDSGEEDIAAPDDGGADTPPVESVDGSAEEDGDSTETVAPPADDPAPGEAIAAEDAPLAIVAGSEDPLPPNSVEQSPNEESLGGEAETEEDVAGAPADAEDTEAPARATRELEEQIVDVLFQGVAQTPTDPGTVNPVEWLVQQANIAATEAAKDPRGLVTAIGILLLTTIFGLLRNIEKALNGIWGVRRTRSWFRMISDYIMITLFLPFIAAIVLGVIAALQSQTIRDELGPLAFIVTGGQQVVICLAFASLYYAVPNTRVKIPYALLGGVVAGTLWVVLSWGYVRFQFGLPNYNLIFTGFALFPMLLMWVYFSWVIFLFGAELSFAYQNERTFAMERYADDASIAYREALAVRAMVEAARRFERGAPGIAPEEAAWEWNVPMRLLTELMENLESSGLVIACATEPVRYLPARPLERIFVGDVVDAIREVGRDPSMLREDEGFRDVYAELSGHSMPAGRIPLSELVRRLEQDIPLIEDRRASDVGETV